MSSCRLIASDMPLAQFAPPRDYPLRIDVDHGTVDDGGADDNYSLTAFANVGDYTQKKYGVCLEWNYTDGRAKQILAYITAALQETEEIEFWHVWLMDVYEFEERPFIHRKTVSLRELTAEHLKEIDNAPIWNTPDRMYPARPSFYCLTVKK